MQTAAETHPILPVPKAWALVGHYFRILAFVSLLKMLAAIVRGKGLATDLSFVLLFWIGRGLLEGRKGPRQAAVVICILFTVLPLAMLGHSVIENLFRKPSWGSQAVVQVAIVTQGLFLALILPPLTMLLRPSLLGMEPATNSGGWSAKRVQGYVLGAMLLGAIFAAYDHSIARVSLTTTSSFFEYGQGKLACSVTSEAVFDKAKGSEFISSWVLGESSSTGLSNHPRAINVGSYSVRPPDVREIEYLRFAKPSGEPLEVSNIVIVRADGRIIPVPRRVTFRTRAAAEAAIKGAPDFDDLQKRVENALPPLPGRP